MNVALFRDNYFYDDSFLLSYKLDYCLFCNFLILGMPLLTGLDCFFGDDARLEFVLRLVSGCTSFLSSLSMFCDGDDVEMGNLKVATLATFLGDEFLPGECDTFNLIAVFAY